jgi:hypothetical protein
MAELEISGIMPFFIVRNVSTALAFYRDRLGFDIEYQGPADDDIFFGIVGRGRATIYGPTLSSAPVMRWSTPWPWSPRVTWTSSSSSSARSCPSPP